MSGEGEKRVDRVKCLGRNERFGRGGTGISRPLSFMTSLGEGDGSQEEDSEDESYEAII
jgi:hypothetical protein